MSGRVEISRGGQDVLRKLDAIGGEVPEAELVHHLGAAAALEAFELAEQGLVEVRTTFELTAVGRGVA